MRSGRRPGDIRCLVSDQGSVHTQMTEGVLKFKGSRTSEASCSLIFYSNSI